MVPVTSLCPCSKEISQYGAHNQRSHVTVSLTANAEVGIEEIIDCVEAQASCQLTDCSNAPMKNTLPKKAYENPKFVEDMVRDVATALIADGRIESFIVESEKLRVNTQPHRLTPILRILNKAKNRKGRLKTEKIRFSDDLLCSWIYFIELSFRTSVMSFL